MYHFQGWRWALYELGKPSTPRYSLLLLVMFMYNHMPTAKCSMNLLKKWSVLL